VALNPFNASAVLIASRAGSARGPPTEISVPSKQTVAITAARSMGLDAKVTHAPWPRLQTGGGADKSKVTA